jgi:UDP-N-acetylmuramoyl-tripeptide--D-alanyl-D-alanine ligase
MQLKLSEIYRLFDRTHAGRDAKVRGISIDSRTIAAGEVFIAIKGDRTDGHKYVHDAVRRGAAAVIAERGQADIIVKDTSDAMLMLAKYYAAKFKKTKIAAITGSNGKTTTKEMLAEMLGECFGRARVLKSEKSFNNHVGVPLTVFKMHGSLRSAVLEMGMNNPGEIARLAKAVKIDTVIITNIGTSHIGRLKSMANIAKAKAEIFGGASRGGYAVLPADDSYYPYLEKKARARGLKIMSFGLGKNAKVRAEIIKTGGSGTVFTLSHGGKKTELEMGVKGTHNVYDAAAAAAAALTLGADIASIRLALPKFKMQGSLRFDEKTIRGIRIIEDCYNANPDSFKAGLETLRSMGLRSIIVVSGDMLELGARSAKYHAEIGAMIARLGVKKLLVYGKYAGALISGFVKAGGSRAAAAAFSDKDKMARALKEAARPGDTVYVKGSRGNKLEDIILSL